MAIVKYFFNGKRRYLTINHVERVIKTELIKNEANIERFFCEAEDIFEKIPEDTWGKFIKSIQWEFIGTTIEQAVEDCTNNIDSLISLLPEDNAQQKITLVKSTLIIVLIRQERIKRPVINEQRIILKIINWIG